MIGKIINNYILERKLGDGGMGEVYYAKHNKVDREVAIKVLHSHLFYNESIHNRFKNEANALIKLNHPNIVKIFDYVEQENFACLIMEYINGYTLDDYISKISGPLPSEKAVSIIGPVLEAVQYAHDNNVFHRDIKPANIMISKDGNKVRIMDFGIAKLTDSKNFKTTHANTQLGTPFYMSPEQIKGLPYSRMSDIYSLGVTLFEMVTGTCPYHNITSLFELQSKIVNQPLPLTSEFYPGVSQRIQNAISIATQKSPELRFQTCSDFYSYLHENDESLKQTRIATPVYQNHSENKNYWVAYVIAGFFLIVVLGFAIKSALDNSGKGGGETIGTVNVPETVNKGNTSVSTQPPTISISDKNQNLLDSCIAAKEKTMNFILPEEKKVNLKNKILALKHQIPTKELDAMCDHFFSELLQEDNLKKFKTYLDDTKRESNKILPISDKNKITIKVRAMNHKVSIQELSALCDGYFVPIEKPQPPIIFPSKDQIMKDFWDKVHQRNVHCRVLFENDDQLLIGNIDFKEDTKDPPDDLPITVRFEISPVGEETEKVSCSVVLNYSKSDNVYRLTK